MVKVMEVLIFICLQVLPRIQKHEILLFAQTDARLANNGLPEELQRLRYMKKDVLAFTGCIEGLTKEEAADVKQMSVNIRYSHDGWRHKPIDSKRKRECGSCPLTPEETALVLQALGTERNTTIYVAGGEIYQKEKKPWQQLIQIWFVDRN
ncbi:hypothetical protein DITRI_Ditri17bG0110800 [Diplodiscus trichospermus]